MMMDAKYAVEILTNYSRLEHWWCPTCKQAILPQNVTFEEYHDNCGTPVEWVEGEMLSKCEQLEKENAELSAKIGQLEQYAELGRLILNGNPCYFGYEYADGDCVSVICSENEKRVCKLRAELLGNNHD